MKTGIRRFWALGWVASLLLGAGCTTSYQGVNTVEPESRLESRQLINDKRIVRDSGTARSVRVLKVFQDVTPEGLLRIGVEVQNQNTGAYRFNYRFDWFDAAGFPVSTPATTMISQQIEPGQMLTLTSVAPNPSVKDFRLSLQKSTRGFVPLLRKN